MATAAASAEQTIQVTAVDLGQEGSAQRLKKKRKSVSHQDILTAAGDNSTTKQKTSTFKHVSKTLSASTATHQVGYIIYIIT